MHLFFFRLKGAQPLASRQTWVKFIAKVLPIQRFDRPVAILVHQIDAHGDQQFIVHFAEQTAFAPASFVVIVTDRIGRKGRLEGFRFAQENGKLIVRFGHGVSEGLGDDLAIGGFGCADGFVNGGLPTFGTRFQQPFACQVLEQFLEPSGSILSSKKYEVRIKQESSRFEAGIKVARWLLRKAHFTLRNSVGEAVKDSVAPLMRMPLTEAAPCWMVLVVST